MAEPVPPTFDEIARLMVGATPWSRALGFAAVSVGDSRARLSIPWREDLVGDPETGVIAGGVVTALLDHTCGASVMAALKRPQVIATLDLRIDYMRGAAPQRTLFAEAHCYKLTRSVAFVRAVAFEDVPEDPVANATAAFMLTGKPRTW
jgi:uncharacterized protein (TIGR00369 family)